MAATSKQWLKNWSSRDFETPLPNYHFFLAIEIIAIFKSLFDTFRVSSSRWKWWSPYWMSNCFNVCRFWGFDVSSKYFLFSERQPRDKVLVSPMTRKLILHNTALGILDPLPAGHHQHTMATSLWKEIPVKLCWCYRSHFEICCEEFLFIKTSKEAQPPSLANSNWKF